jgi:hypothetical protein
MWPWPAILCFWANKATQFGHIESGSYGEGEIEVSGQAAKAGIRLRYSFTSGSKATTFADDRLAPPDAHQLRMAGTSKPWRPKLTNA